MEGSFFRYLDVEGFSANMEVLRCTQLGDTMKKDLIINISIDPGDLVFRTVSLLSLFCSTLLASKIDSR